jgi:ubiquitin-like-conjugating enzyme ATG3
LRRATSLAYTDADEDAERLVSFADSSAPSVEGDEWVETHAGRQDTVQSAADHSAIEEIPDIDGTGDDITSGVGSLSLGGKAEKEPEVIDLDDIPDMEEEDLEDGDEATAAPAPKVVAPKTTTSNIVDARSVFSSVRLRNIYLSHSLLSAVK